MKFHCDKCEARYSISDDRVRGKILKVRCKKCTHVITVSEDAMTEEKQKPLTPGPLKGQFEEWFLAIAGKQSGPFSLDEAKEWIKGKPHDVEIHCWTEGYDKWKVSERVSHFRGIKNREKSSNPIGLDLAMPSSSLGANLGSVDKGHLSGQNPGDSEWADDQATRINDEQNPLAGLGLGPGDSSGFMAPPQAGAPHLSDQGREADVFEQNAREARESQHASLFDSVPAKDEDLDFDIGEASRVVQLPELMAANAQNLPYSGQGGAGGASSGFVKGDDSFGAGGFGRNGFGGQVSSGTSSILPSSQESKKKDKKLLILFSLGGLLLMGLFGLLVFKFWPDSSGKEEISRGAYGGTDLGAQFENGQIREKTVIKEVNKETGRKVPRRNSRQNRTNNVSTTKKTTKTRGTGAEEFEFGGTKKATGPLDGGDLVKAVKKYHPYIKRCYERALKKDPFLKSKKANVSVKVSSSGKVTSVKIPGLSGTELGNCLQGNIRRWKFRESSETFSGQFPLIFGS